MQQQEKIAESYLIAHFNSLQTKGIYSVEIQNILEHIKVAFHDYEPQSKLDETGKFLFKKYMKEL